MHEAGFEKHSSHPSPRGREATHRRRQHACPILRVGPTWRLPGACGGPRIVYRCAMMDRRCSSVVCKIDVFRCLDALLCFSYVVFAYFADDLPHSRGQGSPTTSWHHQGFNYESGIQTVCSTSRYTRLRQGVCRFFVAHESLEINHDSTKGHRQGRMSESRTKWTNQA